MLEREALEAMLAEGCSLEEIGQRVGRDATTVSYWAKKHGLHVPLREKHAPKGGVSRDLLAELVAQGLSTRQIAERVGMTPTPVRRWLKRYGLQTQRARQLRSARSGEQFMSVCSVHGKTVFQIRSDGVTRSLERARAEARKCVLLCATCHAEVESGFVTLSV